MKHLLKVSVYLLMMPAISLAAFNLTSGNATAQFLGSPIWNSATGGDINIYPNGGTSGDQVYKYAWYYRTPGNNTNRIFSSLNTPSEVAAGDAATVTYLNAGPGVAGQERFDALFELKLIDGAAADQWQLECKLTFKNVSNGPVTFQVFNLVDFDLGGTLSNDVATVVDTAAVRMQQNDAAGDTNPYAQHYGQGATAYEVGASLATRTKVSSGSANLNNTATYTGDAASAMQWTLQLQPGESRVIHSGIALNSEAIPEPAGLALLALGGLFGFRRR